MIYASHQGIPYELAEQGPGEWVWSFQPPQGLRRRGTVRGDYRFAVTVVQRGIDVWNLMNKPRSEAA